MVSMGRSGCRACRARAMSRPGTMVISIVMESMESFYMLGRRMGLQGLGLRLRLLGLGRLWQGLPSLPLPALPFSEGGMGVGRWAGRRSADWPSH